MDGSRFDELSRALANGAPRRTFLKYLLGSLAGLADVVACAGDGAACS